MDIEQEALHRCNATLFNSLDTSAICKSLKKNGLLTTTDLEKLQSECSSCSEKIQFLLNTLPGKGQWWDSFIKSLEQTSNGTDHSKIVKELVQAKKDIENKGTGRGRSSTLLKMLKSNPSKKKLANFVVPRIASNWYEVGVMLLDEEQEDQLDVIKEDLGDDDTLCCMEMFWYWLDTKRDANWQNLIDALLAPAIDLRAAAADIEKMLAG